MKIALLGGGIAGLSTAIALKQEGFEVDIYERHSQPSEIGAGIVCWPNACFVLEKLGILDKVANVSGSLNYMKRFSNTGESLGSLDISKLNQLMTYPSYAIIRKDLMNILTQRVLALNIRVHYQHTVTSLTTDDKDKVSVNFANGLNIEPDIIVGADGRMNSIARKYVHGKNTPIYQGFINWIGVFESNIDVFPELSVADYWGIGERFGIVPVSKNKAYWAGGLAASKVTTAEPEHYKSELNSLFSNWPDPITKIINETPLSRIHKIYVHDHNPINSWHKNNVILLGDAAHSPLPTSGQGACQALEDAWHFTNYLKENVNDIPKAFKIFAECRMSKTSGITMAGRQLASSIFNQSPGFCQQRDLASKQTDFGNAVIGMAKLWSSGLPIHV